MHARDPENLADCTQRSEVFMEINARIRERCPDLIVNNTTGGGPTVTMDDRYEGLGARPELASLNLGPDMSRFKIPPRPAPLPHAHDGFLYDDCIPFTYGIVEQLARRMHEYGIKPELEIYQPGQFWVSRFVIDEGLVEPPYLHQFVMGYQTSSWPTPEALAALVRDLPEGSVYSVCGIGPFQLPMTTMSTLMGGHVRVGLEDNIYHSRGRKLAGNGEAVERAVRIARGAEPRGRDAGAGARDPRSFDGTATVRAADRRRRSDEARGQDRDRQRRHVRHGRRRCARPGGGGREGRRRRAERGARRGGRCRDRRCLPAAPT